MSARVPNQRPLDREPGDHPEEIDATGKAVAKGISSLRAQRRIELWKKTIDEASRDPRNRKI